jgi:membrane-bound lytic murein transglycosylase D
MSVAKIFTLTLFTIAFSVFGCSHPQPEWTTSTPSEISNSVGLRDTLVTGDTTQIAKLDIDMALDKAEGFYAVGVHYFQISQLDSAQAAYEQSLTIMSELDLDPEQNPDQASRMERLLDEIEEDYRLTLVASGRLSSDASVTAFRELFTDLKNFSKLKESGEVKEFNEADTAIYDIDIEWNNKVENSLIYLQTVARDKFTAYLARSAAYLPIMEKIFKDRGLPHDLVYLPLIESGFNASAYSYAKASGFWQFISSTGRLYGLDHSWWFDERRDFIKSTDAAARHLKDLYNQFGSWNLALAAYNAGAGRVSREIKRSKSNDYWKLVNLHPQTKTYVPLFMAATIIAKQPHKYGFFPDYEKALEYDSIQIGKCLSFNSISNKTGINVFDLERLNPELLRGMTPPNENNYVIRIPKGSFQSFTSIYKDIPAEQPSTWARHKVKKGETLSSISNKYGIPASTILEANELSKKRRLYVGQMLNIPIAKRGESLISEKTEVASNEIRKPVVKENPGRYRVKAGDTLWEIAVAYGVSIKDIKRHNDLSSSNLYAGRWLKIPPSSENANIETAAVRYDIYRVRKGDTLSKVSRRYGTSPEAIKDANNLPSNKLYTGMNLKIPSKGSTNTQYTKSNANSSSNLDYKIHTVRRGDTLWKIAKIYGVEVGEIAKWNNMTTRNRIQPGDKLKIYFN